MSYPINYPTPQGANIQIFNQGGTTYDWVKPQGASFVWFTLIGAGGGLVIGSAGGSTGAVTNFMGPAFLMPDVLRVSIGVGSAADGTGLAAGATSINYQQKDGTGYTLLTANGARSGGLGASASVSNAFTAMGFFQSIAGATDSSSAASTTTFLSGGATNATALANYGYTSSRAGFFQMQPIIVGVGGGGASAGANGGIGCGGGGGSNGRGGDGMAIIITW